MAQVLTYPLYLNDHYVRKATKVVLADGTEYAFTERMTKKEALTQVMLEQTKGFRSPRRI